MPLVVGGWLDVLLIIVEEEEEEDKEEVEEEEVEEEMLIGEDIDDTGVDSAVVDNVDDSVDEVGTGVDVLDIELDEDATEVDDIVVEIRGVGDSTMGVVDPVELLCPVVNPSVVVVGGTELDPAVVDSVVEGAVVDWVVGGIVVGGSPQMQIPHSALVVGRVEPAVDVETRVDVEEVDDPSR